jgi:hypothetical protein
MSSSAACKWFALVLNPNVLMRRAGIRAAAAERERLEAGSHQQEPQEAADTAAGRRSDDAAADTESDDAADAAAMQAALSRHGDDHKSPAGRSGILGLSDDLDAYALVSCCQHGSMKPWRFTSRRRKL